MKKIFVVAAVLALTGCASQTPNQIIDMQGVDAIAYQRDLADCNQYADQVDVGGSVAQGAVGGAIIGAIVGGLIGGSDGAVFGAKVFGVSGAAEGAASSAHDKRAISTRCMTGRGYKVLL